jgi:hypothetical protein
VYVAAVSFQQCVVSGDALPTVCGFGGSSRFCSGFAPRCIQVYCESSVLMTVVLVLSYQICVTSMKAHEILTATISVMSMTGLRRRCPGSLCSYDDHNVRDFLYSALITVFVQNTETTVPFYSDVLYVFVSVVSMTAFLRIVL